MKQIIVLAVVFLSAAPARADFLYKLVGYQCDPEADEVVLTYTGALNEAGKKMMKDSVVVRNGLEPCVSPDGRFILYQAYGDPCGPDESCICAVSLDGKIRVKLLPGGSHPVW